MANLEEAHMFHTIVCMLQKYDIIAWCIATRYAVNFLSHIIAM